MADVKITDYNALAAAPDDADIIEIVDDVAGIPTSKKITIAYLHNLLAPKATPTFTGLITNSGGQIAFPATAVPSANANTLDDYEEGNWTPALEGSVTAGDTTYITQTGRYEKIGRQVTIRGRIAVNAQGTLDGNVSIIGLPFTAMAGAHTFSPLYFGYASSLNITAGESLIGYVNANSTKASIRIWNFTGGATFFDDAELTDGADLIFAGTYTI